MGPLPSTGTAVGHVAQAFQAQPRLPPPRPPPPPPGGWSHSQSSTPARAGPSCQPLPGQLGHRGQPALLGGPGEPLDPGSLLRFSWEPPVCWPAPLWAAQARGRAKDGGGELARPRGGGGGPPGCGGGQPPERMRGATPFSGPGAGSRVCFRRRWQVSVCWDLAQASAQVPPPHIPLPRASLWERVFWGLVCMEVVLRGHWVTTDLVVCIPGSVVGLITHCVWIPWSPSVSGGLLGGWGFGVCLPR